jgi:hypothetical protein
MEAQLHQTREACLNYVAQRIAPMFENLGAPLPAQLRIAIGFTSSGRRSRSTGECRDNQCSQDRHFEIFIRPDLSESKDLLPMQVTAVLAHELARRGWRRRAPRQGVPASCQRYRAGRANGGHHSRARVREGHAADTGSCRAAATRQTSAGHWRQQPFQQAQKAVLSPDQVRL